MRKLIHQVIHACLLTLLFAAFNPNGVTQPLCIAQTPTPSPTSPQPNTQTQESIKVYTEEVVLPVIATDNNGRFDPTLEIDDLLVLEDGVPQTVQSIGRLPADVLLLLDTSGARNPEMKTNTTRDLAVRLVSELRAGDRVAVIQFGGRVELIQQWSSDRDITVQALRTKLFSGRRTLLVESLGAAVVQLKAAPAGNRHVVLVTDGGELTTENSLLKESIAQLLSSRATVHVLSYTLMGRKTIKKLHPKYPASITVERPKSAIDLSDELTKSPNDPDTLDTKLNRKIYIVIQTDFPIWKHNREYAQTLKENEQWLAWLAEESGGKIILPHSSDELPKLTDELVRQIDSQYVVTYKPKSKLTLKSAQAVRHIEVASRRVGLYVHSRRSYVVSAPSQ